MTKFYLKQPIEAEQFDGSDEMIKKYDIKLEEGDYTEDYGLSHDGVDPVFYERYFISTLEGVLECSVGDWIATGAKGEHWLIVDDVFQRTYAELPVIPQVIADYIEKCKHQHRSLASALMEIGMPTDVQDYFRNYQSTERWIWLQDNFARAWLDGYQVEEEK